MTENTLSHVWHIYLRRKVCTQCVHCVYTGSDWGLIAGLEQLQY